jgi:glycosyltransferase involved in cell wall biosynthesis
MIRALAERGRPRGYELELVLGASAAHAADRPWVRDLEAGGMRIRFAPPEGRRGLTTYARNLLRDEPSDAILHTHMTLFDAPVAVAAAGSRRRVIWHIHSTFGEDLGTKLRNVARFGILGRSVAGVFCVSPQLAASVQARGGPRSKIHWVPNGIDTDRFPLVDPAVRGAARASMGIPDDAKVVLHFGWDWRRKGGDLVMEALAQIRADHDVLLLTVSGEAATAAAAAAGVTDVVRVLDAVEDPVPLLSTADVFAAPSRAEGDPLAVLEAVSSGIPVAASDIPAHRARAPIPGMELVPLDAPSLARALSAALRHDPESARAQAVTAHDWVVEHASARGWADRILALYDEILDGERGARTEAA